MPTERPDNANERIGLLEIRLRKRMERLVGPDVGFFETLKTDRCAVCGGPGPFAIEQWYEVPRDRIKWQLCESCAPQVDVVKVRQEFKARLGQKMANYRTERIRNLDDLKSSAEPKTR